MLHNAPSPLETRIVSKRFGLPNSETLDTDLAADGFTAFHSSLAMTRDRFDQLIDGLKKAL